MRETKYTAIILKKQPFGEADEIVTVYSREAGKLRFLAKAIKSPKSKLQYALQSLFYVKLRAVGRNLPKAISCQVLETFPFLREQIKSAHLAHYALELLVKFTADEHKNPKLFELFWDFLTFLNHRGNQKYFSQGLAKFKISFLELVGYSIHSNNEHQNAPRLFFSNNKGGFTTMKTSDGVPVATDTFGTFYAINKASFNEFKTLPELKNLQELQHLLSGFLEFHLEREIKSQKFLDAEDVV